MKYSTFVRGFAVVAIVGMILSALLPALAR